MALCSLLKLSMYTGSAAFKNELPTRGPAVPSNGQDPCAEESTDIDVIREWTRSRTSQLDVVILTSALIAAVVSGVFSWQVIDGAPWTSVACFYSALILSLIAIFSGSQQSIALHRASGRSVRKLWLSLWARRDSRAVAYIFQLPVMMMNISIWMFIVGLLILIWERAASSNIWGGDMKIAFVATLATVFALSNYILGSVFIWRLNNELYTKSSEKSKGKKKEGSHA